jgi:hypothetical protein
MTVTGPELSLRIPFEEESGMHTVEFTGAIDLRSLDEFADVL